MRRGGLALAGAQAARVAQEERDVQPLLEQTAVELHEAALGQRLAVVRRHDQERLVEPPVAAPPLDPLGEPIVDVPDAAVVQRDQRVSLTVAVAEGLVPEPALRDRGEPLGGAGEEHVVVRRRAVVDGTGLHGVELAAVDVEQVQEQGRRGAPDPAWPAPPSSASPPPPPTRACETRRSRARSRGARGSDPRSRARSSDSRARAGALPASASPARARARGARRRAARDRAPSASSCAR